MTLKMGLESVRHLFLESCLYTTAFVGDHHLIHVCVVVIIIMISLYSFLLFFFCPYQHKILLVTYQYVTTADLQHNSLALYTS